MPSRPSSPIFGHRSRGKSLSRSIGGARRDLGLRKILRGLADRVGGFAQIELKRGAALGIMNGVSLSILKTYICSYNGPCQARFYGV